MQDSKYRKFVICFAAVLALIGIGYGGYRYANELYSRHLADMDRYNNVLAPRSVMENLEGIYSLHYDEDGPYTAEVQKADVGEYIIIIRGKYGSQRHSMKLDQGSKVSSYTLGSGTVYYKQHVNKITITFEINGRICELEK